MLTSDLAMSWRRGRSVVPKYVPPSDAAHARTAADLIAIVSAHVGEPRRELDRSLDEFIGAGTDYRVIRGMVKLLLDRCRFETAAAVDPPELRRAVFAAARDRHPVDAETREATIAGVARRLGVDATAVESGLYADLAENQLLVEFAAPEAGELLDAYNLAQAQALLYRCAAMDLSAFPQPAAGYRRLFDAVKDCRLIYTIAGDARSGYELRLDGPVSMFHRSQKYGIQMAVFLPELLRCDGWSLRAEIDTRPQGTAVYELESSQTRLRVPERDRPERSRPAVERILAGLGTPEGGWSGEPSAEVVDLGRSAAVPDITARHADGTVVPIEVLGFWTPRSLGERLTELDRGGVDRYLLVVSDELRASRDPLDEPPARVVVYKSAPDLRAIRAALERLRGGSPGGAVQ